MNNQKFFLIVAILLSLFLLKEQWDRQHTVDANGNLIYQQKTSNAASVTNDDKNLNVPSAIVTHSSPDVPVTKSTNDNSY
ncbi:MAG: membrane protein insertase YidC, partial [Candidatus Thioglobus sp.]|nr:membrane protein insertase YidC [Candidatus Thioglobus sp.]